MTGRHYTIKDLDRATDELDVRWRDILATATVIRDP